MDWNIKVRNYKNGKEVDLVLDKKVGTKQDAKEYALGEIDEMKQPGDDWRIVYIR